MDTLDSIASNFVSLWHGTGDFCQEKWNRFIDLVGEDDFTVWMHGTAVITTLTYWIVGGLFMYMDFTLKPKSLRKYKIQRGTNEPLDWPKFKKALKVILFNQLVVGPPVFYVVFLIMQARGFKPLRVLPSFQSILIDNVIFALIREPLSYYSHRAMHYKGLYKMIHKKHHEWTSPVAVTAVYCHPIEHVISNLIPALFGIVVMKSHVVTTWIWMTYILVDTLHDHSGYHLPFMSSSEFHDFHHEKFNYNFGVFGFLDRLHGTDSAYQKAGGYKRHKMLLGLKSAREQFPDVKKTK